MLRTFIHGTPGFEAADKYYADRMVKTMLWLYGGWKVYISGDEGIYEYIRAAYTPEGSRAFDQDFMAGVYERPFEVVSCAELPAEKSNPQAIGRHLDGCRIGFDAGGSDRKVSAVIDGKSVFSEEVVWFPKTTADPDYHFQGIVDAFKSAAAHMPHVDAIGVSSAGIYIENRAMVASLFLKVPKDEFDKKVKDIYIRAAREIGDVPLVVANDGDVTALAGAMSLDDNNVLGIAMGTSEAVGYVDANGCVTGWLNELAFMPVDANPDAMADEWSGDFGCGVKYFSQDGVIKLAPRAGIELTGPLPRREAQGRQGLMENGDERAAKVYESIGVYLAHAFALLRFLRVQARPAAWPRHPARAATSCSPPARPSSRTSTPDRGQHLPSLPDEKFRRVSSPLPPPPCLRSSEQEAHHLLRRLQHTATAATPPTSTAFRSPARHALFEASRWRSWCRRRSERSIL
ncbi:MAG: ROK family protein [Oscillospiraceae bacterium]